MGPDSAQSVTLGGDPGPAGTAEPNPQNATRPSARRGAHTRAGGLFPRPSWMAALAFAIVIIPFAIILARLALASQRHIYLPDDLALIDLHTRRALQWKQQLGVFDRYDWNHPGPTYFYLLSVAYRVFGSGAQAMFIGATALNALAAVGCVEVVRRRTTPARALWAAIWICALASLMATESLGSLTYSESALGALVSPWNPMVVIFPLLLFFLLCAAAIDRSMLSLAAAVLVGSFIVQTNISTLPLLAGVLVVTLVIVAVTAVTDRRKAKSSAVVGVDLTGLPEAPITPEKVRPPRWHRPALYAGGLVVLVLMWLPPIIQQLTNHPGNFTLIYRFFSEGHKHWPFPFALRSVASVFGVLLVGPSEIMSSYLGRTPHHALLAYGATAVVLIGAVVVTVVGIGQRQRFAAGLASLSLVGSVAMVLGITRVVNYIYGYLVIWAIVIPIAALISLGMVQIPWPARSTARRPFTSTPSARLALCGIGVLASIVLAVRVVYIPALDTVSNPYVARLSTLVTPKLDLNGSVLVGDNGAGTGTSELVDTEEFIGLVNQLDQSGFHPKVNHVWKPEFGPGYLTTNHEDRQIQLYTWTPSSPSKPGYVGRAGDIAVLVLTYYGQPVPK
jgi:hypothetical protein